MVSGLNGLVIRKLAPDFIANSLIAADASEVMKYISQGYGDVALDMPVPSRFGRHVIEFLMDHDFDISHMAYTEELYGGKIARRYPTPEGELELVRVTEPRPMGQPYVGSGRAVALPAAARRAATAA